MIGQFQPNTIDDYSWNMRLCECLEDLNRLLYESYGIAELPNLFVNTTWIDPNFAPHYATTTKQMRDLWNILNYMGVADSEADTCGTEKISTVDDKRLTKIYHDETISNRKTKLLDKQYGGNGGDKEDLDAYYDYENNDFSEDDKSAYIRFRMEKTSTIVTYISTKAIPKAIVVKRKPKLKKFLHPGG